MRKEQWDWIESIFKGVGNVTVAEVNAWCKRGPCLFRRPAFSITFFCLLRCIEPIDLQDCKYRGSWAVLISLLFILTVEVGLYLLIFKTNGRLLHIFHGSLSLSDSWYYSRGTFHLCIYQIWITMCKIRYWELFWKRNGILKFHKYARSKRSLNF